MRNDDGGADRTRMFQAVEAERLERAYEEEAERQRGEATRAIVIGAIFVAVGLTITIATHQAAVAGGGGTYIVAYGPIVYGVITLLRGLMARS